MAIIIRTMKEHERERVTLFVRDTMRSRYGSDAYALPEIVVTAWHKSELVGTMAAALSHAAPFHVEELYAIRYEALPFPFERERIAELGRFAVRVPGIAEGLLYAAILHASRYGCVWGIGEVKPAMMRRYAKMGVVVMPIEGEPIIENVPPGARPYYAPPAPQLAAIAFAHTAMALQEKVVQCVANGTISFLE